MAEDTRLVYKKIFDPPPTERASEAPPLAGDQRRAVTYVYTDEIVLAVNVALATRRPLLVRGPSGTGKSSLARSIADILGWRYYEYVVTSRTQARDMLWQIDLLRRLQDAQSARLDADYAAYVTPGVLWWAFDEAGAREQRTRGAAGRVSREPNLGATHARAVVLIDEIDKADPDTPNNLLVPLGSLQFQVEETNQSVSTRADLAPLLLITTNEERELPLAFLRRCVGLDLTYPSRNRLLEIGKAQLPNLSAELRAAFADAMLGPPSRAPSISPAEYIDALHGGVELGIAPNTPEFERLLAATVWKHGRKGSGR